GEASFTQLRDYAAGPTCTWAPTQDGYYNLRVFCREEGSPGGYDKQTTIRDYVNATPLTALALSANPASPMLTVPPDDPITLTAAPTGGLNLEYRFYVKRGRDASYTLVQDYSAADTYAWTPTVADCYLLMAYAREVGSALTYDATTATAYYVGYQPLTGVALSAQESSPQPLQTPIHLTATPTGGANLEYEFAVKRGADSAWTILRAYGAGTTLTWTPAEATYYRLRVSAREVGRTGGIQTASLDYYIGTTPLTAVATSADPASPQAPQTPITLTAAPTGGVAPEYRFWIKRGQEADWTDARDYATTATHVWTPMVADFYLIRVWARETGNPASYQVIAPRVPYYIGTTPLSAVALAANPSSPQPVHGPITLTATPTGGAVPEYKFQVKRAGAPTWVTLQDYSPTATCPWTPTVPDTYTLRVHGREIGNDLVSYSVAATVTYVIGTPPTVSLTAPPHEAVYHAPTSVTLTADAADDGAVARVEFYQGATKLGEDTTAPYSYTWDAVPAGTYSLTAVAIDDIGLATTSTPVEITVNTRPTIVLTAPAPGESFSAPASIEAIATAEDEDGTVTQVDFYHGTTLLATDTAAPFIVSLPQVDEGVYTLHAVATDDRGGTAESAPITYHIRPLNAPVVLLTAPEAGHVFAPGTDITVT
ncbi:MAG TPA: Ig-like domain-containing protein, partial [Armatimonadota bacterium]|nr:Ig-like domain-containing protein [Armatimonadota bacterium]